MSVAPARRTVVFNTVIPVTETPPENPYFGQMWVNPETSILMTWNGSAWTDLGVSPGDFNVLSGIVTEHDNKILQNSEAIQLRATKTEVNALNALVGLKSSVYYLASAPADGMTTGDLWIDTDDGNKLYRYSGTAWVAVDDARLQQALAAAGTAQATADGKVRTFSQPSAPTGMKAGDVGDLWIDTDDNNKLYRWSGTGWVNVQDTHLDGTVSTLSASITTMAGQISAKAEKSTVDALGNRMTTAEANITAVPGKIEAAVTELVLGGTNLLLNSDVPVNTASWLGGNASTIARVTTSPSGSWPGRSTACLRNTSASGQTSTQSYQNVKLIPGEKYTASGWFYIPSGTAGNFAVRAYNESWGAVGTAPLITARNAWVFSSVTFTAPSTTYTHISFGASGVVAGTVFYTYQMKLEKGDKATDWSPAPQDPAQSLATGTAVTITPANGLEVTQTLSNGTKTLPVKFKANASQFGLYRSSDNLMLAGAGVLPDGRGYFASNVTKDPSVSTKFFTEISTERIDLSSVGEGIWYNYGTFYKYGSIDCGGIKINIDAAELNNPEMFIGGGLDTGIVICPGDYYGTGAMGSTSISYLRLAPHGNGAILGCDRVDTGEQFIHFDPIYARVWVYSAGNIEMDAPILYTKQLRPRATATYSIGNNANRYLRVYVTQSESVSSDARLKTEIEDLDGSLIYKVRPRRFKLTNGDGKWAYGIIAQELKDAMDELGIENVDLYDDENPESLAIIYQGFISPLIAAVQEQKARIDSLEARLAALESRLG